MFLKELRKVVVAKDGADLRPSYKDLKQLAYHNSLPFVGFGFLDNLIMIMAGEYIDLTLGNYDQPTLCSLFLSRSSCTGMKFGMSTMAAAALGNTISDLLGIGSAWYVESLADKLGEGSLLYS